MKNCSDEFFVDSLKSVNFLNNVYQDFVTKILSALDSVSPIRTLIVNSNAKTRFYIDVLNVI